MPRCTRRPDDARPGLQGSWPRVQILGGRRQHHASGSGPTAAPALFAKIDSDFCGCMSTELRDLGSSPKLASILRQFPRSSSRCRSAGCALMAPVRPSINRPSSRRAARRSRSSANDSLRSSRLLRSHCVKMPTVTVISARLIHSRLADSLKCSGGGGGSMSLSSAEPVCCRTGLVVPRIAFSCPEARAAIKIG